MLSDLAKLFADDSKKDVDASRIVDEMDAVVASGSISERDRTNLKRGLVQCISPTDSVHLLMYVSCLVCSLSLC